MSWRAVVSADGSGIHELVVEASPSGIVVCDEAGTILLANRRLEEMFGYAPGELIGWPIDTLVPPMLRGSHVSERNRYWRNPTSRAMGAGRNLYGRRRDGATIPIEIELTAAGRDGQRLVVASVVDISERVARKKKDRAIAVERIAFERLVADLAARFVKISPEHVDETITDSQRRIVEALGIDRSILWQLSDDGSDLVPTHVWIRPEFSAPPPPASTRELFPWLVSKIRAGEAIWNATPDDVPSAVDRESLRRFGTKSSVAIPLAVEGRVIGAVSFATMRAERSWDSQIRERLSLVAAVFAHALARRRSQERLQKALTEVDRLRQRLARENVQLRHEVSSLKVSRPLAAESPAVRAVLEQIESVARTSATVLLTGETGCGKEVFAQAIHDLSDRRDRPVVRVNCAAIPAALIENELFGRERGAYTGALSRQIGRFELADGTTLFLDEVGELPLESQAKLLRVVQDRVIERLGSTATVNVDVRLIAATNRDLGQAVADRTFREDLFYRLNVFPIHVPPLRERVEDIPVLVWTFIEEFSNAFGKPIESISKQSLEALKRYAWPGNVRELRNLIERAVILASGPCLDIDVPSSGPIANRPNTLAEVETGHIRDALERAGWRVRGRGGAAEQLGMKATTLDSRMMKLGIRRPNR